MFKDLRTSTKLFLLCGTFVGAIVLTTYSLIEEKQIALGFVRKELAGAQYLQALQKVYEFILAGGIDASHDAPQQPTVDAALDALAAAGEKAATMLHTGELAQELAAAVRKLPSDQPNSAPQAQTVAALAKARDLAARIGDESNLTLDPDLDSYYVQHIVVKQVPSLLAQMGEMQSLLQAVALNGAAASADLAARVLLLDGMIGSTMDEIGRNSAAAYRDDPGGRPKQPIAGAIDAMSVAVRAYRDAAGAAMDGQSSSASLAQSYLTALEKVSAAWTVSHAELKRLLDKRLSELLKKLRRSLGLNGLIAGLSLFFAAMVYRQIVRPLRQLEQLAGKVRDTKDYRLRTDLDRRDEIGQLAGAFNAMLSELATAREREIADQERNAAMQAELARVARVTTMGEMAASIAHEINQPLAAVVNNANAGLRWLNNQPPNVDEVKIALRRIVHDGERGSGIIESIRAMIKKGDRNRAPLNLNELIGDVMRLIEGQFQRHGVSIQSELADNLPKVVADRIQLQQVILNLFMNAAEATGAISDRERLVRVRSEKYNGEGALISVEDTGTGVEPEDAKRIFDAFFTTKADGMGMGLSICRSVVEAHGGRIMVARANPHGSVFQVILPGVGA